MPEKINITEYYSVSCRPYDDCSVSLLENAARAFFSDGSSSGSVRRVENGIETKTRYRLGTKRFRWKKVCRGVTLEEAFAVAGGGFCLVAHDADGRLLSSRAFDTGLRWQSTAYYDGSIRDPAVLLQRGGEGIYRTMRGSARKELLFPCLWEPGTAEQSFVNEVAGEPVVVAGTDAGRFCFCTAEECALRGTLREKADQEGGLSLSGEEEETLDFQVVPNAPSLAAKPSSMMRKKDVSASVVPERAKPSEQIKKAPAPTPCTEDGEGYAADHEILTVPPRRPTRYAVAIKGLSGGVRGGPAFEEKANEEADASAEPPPAPEPPTEPPGSAVIPARRIVVSSMESYLYFGKLMEGLREGRGRTAAPDGRTAYEGNYRNDMREGFGVYYYKSGKLCYAGEWKRNLRNGLGVAFGAKDGSIFVGNWKNGSATGPGSEFDLCGDLTYTGGWKDGHRHGYGTEYRNGRVLRSGRWSSDVFCGEDLPGEAT